MKTFQQFLDTPITEGNKSGDSSLHDWFSKSKSSDGKPGWVQAGGRFAGKPCAKQPGQTTKPKCISSKMKRNMSKDEEQAAHRRKNREDPNPNRKGKAINVSTEGVKYYDGSDRNPNTGLPKGLKPDKKKPNDKPMTAPPYNMAKANEETEVDECWKTHKKVGMKKKGGKMVPDCRPKTSMGEAKKFGKDTKIPTKSITDPNVRDKNLTPGNPIEKKLKEACWKGYEKKGMKTMFGKRYPNCVKKTKKEDFEYATEAKVDQGRSDYGKASIRNYRRKGPGYGEPAMFDPENKRGKLIDKRREEHKERRGVKGAKVPAYKVSEEHKNPKSVKGIAKELDKAVEMHKSQAKRLRAANVSEDMSGMSQKSGDKRSTESGAGMTAKGVAKYNRRTGGNLKTAVTTPPSKLKPGSKAAKRRKSFCARSKSWTGPRGKAARRRWNCSYEPEGTPIMEKKEDKAFNFVLDKLRKQHGKDNIVTKDSPMKKQSAADKAKARAHQAKVDKENAAERKKDPSQGRYPKG